MADVLGKIVQVMGPVLDVEFPEGQVPAVNNCLKLTNPSLSDATENLTAEVALHLGDNVVRAIAMDGTDGLARGLSVRDTGEQISVPVGKEVLGRILNVVGEPVDEQGPVNAKKTYPIHNSSPRLTQLDSNQEVLVTGIKVVDLMAPFLKGGKIGLFGGCWCR